MHILKYIILICIVLIINQNKMKVQQVKIKEFKALKDINVEVNGHHLLVMGDNGVGKSSFIQLLEIAMGRQNNLPINAKGEAETTFLHKSKLSSARC